ncbi:hypothetical protein ES703_60821 [subsurface metagenome]
MRKFIVPLLTAVIVVSIVFAGCVPGAAPPVTPPPVTPPVTPPPVTPPPEQPVLDMRGAPTTLPESAIIPPGDTYPIRIVEIGQLEPTSGPFGWVGMTDTQGAEMGVELCNNDGGVIINNERVFFTLFKYDDRSDPKLSMAGAELMKERGIKVIHVLGVEMSIAIQTVTEPAGIIIHGYNWDLDSMREGLHYSFSSDCIRERIPFYAPYYVNELGCEKVGFITENVPVWLDTTEYMIRDFTALGCECVASEIHESDCIDFYPHLTKLKGMDMDALVVSSGAPTSALICKQRLELGWPVQILGTDVMYGEGTPFFKIAGDAANGVIEQAWCLEPLMEFEPWLVDVMEIDPERRARVNNALLERFGREGYSPYQAVTSDFIKYEIEAMVLAQSWDDGDKIKEAMEQLDFYGGFVAMRYYDSDEHWRFHRMLYSRAFIRCWVDDPVTGAFHGEILGACKPVRPPVGGHPDPETYGLEYEFTIKVPVSIKDIRAELGY